MEDSLSIIEEEMEQLEVSTGEMTDIDSEWTRSGDWPKWSRWLSVPWIRELGWTSEKISVEMLEKMMWSEDSNTNDDGDDDYDERPREERIPHSRISWLVLMFLDEDNGRDVGSLDPSPLLRRRRSSWTKVMIVWIIAILKIPFQMMREMHSLGW